MRVGVIFSVLAFVLAGCGGTNREAPATFTPILEGSALYENLPEAEGTFWGNLGDKVPSHENIYADLYMFELYEAPPETGYDNEGLFGVYRAGLESDLQPFFAETVVLDGKLVETGQTYPTLYIGKVARSSVPRIGCDPRRISAAEREGFTVLHGDCTRYLERPEAEARYQGTLRRRESRPLPPATEARAASGGFDYYLTAPEGELALSTSPLEASVLGTLASLLGRPTEVYGKRLQGSDTVMPSKLRALP